MSGSRRSLAPAARASSGWRHDWRARTMSDASFEDGAERPLRLVAVDADDVTVISSLLQDAVLSVCDIRWDRRRRELALLVHRFRWEDSAAAEARGRGY